MDSPEYAHHRKEPEVSPSFDLAGKSAHQILDEYSELVDEWNEDRWGSRSHLYGDGDLEHLPSIPPLLAFDEQVRKQIRANPELAGEIIDAIEEFPDAPRTFSDMILVGYVAAELTRGEPELGKAIWVRAMLSGEAEIAGPARKSLYYAIRDQALPPELLADVVFTLTSIVGDVAERQDSAKEEFARRTTPNTAR